MTEDFKRNLKAYFGGDNLGQDGDGFLTELEAFLTSWQVEPSGNLDSKSTKQLLKLFEYILEKYNTTILMVTHDPLVASYCNKVMFINDGEIYNQLYNEGDNSVFYNSIINLLQNMGGDSHESKNTSY